jgi:comEA protein
MKKLAFLISAFSLAFSLILYFNRAYQYEKFRIEPRSSELKAYKINVNLANTHEFENLPGIGPKLAEAIIHYRETQGRFNSIQDLMKVRGIGPKKFAKFENYLTMEV